MYVPVRDMIVEDLIVATIVVVVTPVLGGTLLPVYLACRKAQIPDFRVLFDLGSFKFRELGAIILHRLFRSHW